MGRLAVIAAVIGLLALTPASALEKGNFEVAIGPDFHFLDNGQGLDNGLGARIRFGWCITDKIELELAASGLSTEDDFGDAAELDSADYTTAALNMIWAIGSQDYQPFLLLGAGLADGDVVLQPATFKFETDSDRGFLFQAGIGSRWLIARHWGVRVQFVGSRVELAGDSYTNLRAGVDFSFVWGQPK